MVDRGGIWVYQGMNGWKGGAIWVGSRPGGLGRPSRGGRPGSRGPPVGCLSSQEGPFPQRRTPNRSRAPLCRAQGELAREGLGLARRGVSCGCGRVSFPHSIPGSTQVSPVLTRIYPTAPDPTRDMLVFSPSRPLYPRLWSVLGMVGCVPGLSGEQGHSGSSPDQGAGDAGGAVGVDSDRSAAQPDRRTSPKGPRSYPITT
jgi:hypothetical protein